MSQYMFHFILFCACDALDGTQGHMPAKQATPPVP
jgi:hypothetical protein